MRRRRLLLAVALLLVALNLRPAVVAVAPLVAEIRADVGLSAAVAGLLTTLPVLCFGVFAPLAPRLSRQVGPEAVLAGAVALLVVGIALRLVPGVGALFLGSAVVGAAIAVGNVLMPALVRRDFPQRTGLMMGAVSMLISGGGAIAAAVIIPVEQVTGFAWRPALALTAILATLALLLWLPFVRQARRTRVGTSPGAAAAPAPGLWRDPLAWQVTGFMGLQSLQFYAATAWIPTIFIDAGRTPVAAGLLLSVAGASSLVSAAVVPTLATRRRTQHGPVAVLLALWAVGYTGLLLAPASPLAAVCMVLIGLGQGMGISLALTLMSLRSADAERTAALSGMAQGAGYVVAATGPFALGALHDATGSWQAPLLALLLLLVPLGACGFGAARDALTRT